MNKSFKVVFNKARGTLMAANEITSSVQAKGTKVAVAVAVAMLAGTAAAAADSVWQDAPSDAVTSAPDWKFEADNYAFNLSSGTSTFLSASDTLKTYTFDKNLWVKGSGKDTRATGIWASGSGVTATNTGKIYVEATSGANSWSQHALTAANGATAINEGTIVAKNGYGMSVGTDKNGSGAAYLVNNGAIFVETQGAGMELGGVANSTAENTGTISVGKVEGNSFTIGVLVKEQSGSTFTNTGTISASEGTAAIRVEGTKDKAGYETTVDNTIVLSGASKVEGLIYNSASGTTFKFEKIGRASCRERV